LTAYIHMVLGGLLSDYGDWGKRFGEWVCIEVKLLPPYPPHMELNQPFLAP